MKFGKVENRWVICKCQSRLEKAEPWPTVRKVKKAILLTLQNPKKAPELASQLLLEGEVEVGLKTEGLIENLFEKLWQRRLLSPNPISLSSFWNPLVTEF